MYTHILLATDGSELATKGVDQGLELARMTGARVTLLSVTEPMNVSEANTATLAGIENVLAIYEQQMDLNFREIVKPIQAKAAEMGITLEAVRETDITPASAIVRTAKLVGADLIVMASHGRRGLQKVLLGSQTSEVLVHTTIPVLVVR